MKKKKAKLPTYKQMMRRMNWPHPETGTPGAVKKKGKRMQANEHLGKGRGGIEDARPLPEWLRKSRQVKKR